MTEVLGLQSRGRNASLQIELQSFNQSIFFYIPTFVLQLMR